MSGLKYFLNNLLGPKKDTDEKPIERLIVNARGHLILLSPDAPHLRGMKVVYVTPALLQRYLRAFTEMQAVQSELKRLPQSLRPRRKSVKQEKTEAVEA